MKKFNLLVLFTIVATFIGGAAALAENFVVDGSNKALNTNNNFRKVDGNPVMSLWEFSSTDRDQQFDRISGNRGGTLLRHGSTGKCLNSHYLTNGGVVNTWPCDANDPDQNFNIISLGNGLSQIQRTGTNLCVDSPTRDNGGKIHVWQCDRNSPNQRFRNGTVTPPPPPPSGQITLPFRSRETWYVCQGYRGSVSHQNSYALDLSVGQDFGSNNACWGDQNRSANRPVLAPAAGKVYHINSDLVCLSIDNNRSMLIGHMNRSVQNGATVNRGDVLGTTSSQNPANGSFSHIHLEGRKSAGCTPGSSVPLTAANGFQLENVGDLVGSETHFKRALTRP
ncbi:ricin B lectin domain-containing protein [Anabaena sp. 90]|uniref:ricin-type beta-trefoil lectin domain protein n=1 Tax=Anabaena sp. 90 TaxID=46234 RepID=UPI00029B7820|nr:ricin-type beta-trefoil lectin domain protein [Anabaena sp. 90]AFW94904.1 ricin B lectin domain-containing protein [Anabaena sp. 90]